jgi:hypothetical protein
VLSVEPRRPNGKHSKKVLLVYKRLDKSWLVFTSIENFEHDRCVDLFSRPDATFGFEEFRRDPEDRGDWTPVHYYSGAVFANAAGALDAAERAVAWLREVLAKDESLCRCLDRSA